jgi:hypothetical protein
VKKRLLVLLSISVTALIAVAAVAPGAWAAKPEMERFVDDDPFEVPAGEICPFLLQFDPDLAGRTATFSDGRTLTNVRGTMEVTNASTGESVSLHLAFSFVDRPLPDGGVRSTARGQSLLFYAEADVIGPGLFFTKGRVVDTFDGTTGAITSVRVSGQRTDICALLS